MKSALIVFALAALTLATVSGQTYTYSGRLSYFTAGDDPNAYGTTSVRTQGDTLFFESTLYNAAEVTAVHLHVSPNTGNLTGGPLLLALTNTTTSVGLSPLSTTGSQPLVQTGTRNNTNLQANAQLPAVRTLLAQRNITGNDVNNIGDVERLLALGIVYSDVHTTSKVSPQRLISGGVFKTTPVLARTPAPAPAPARSAGRKLLEN